MNDLAITRKYTYIRRRMKRAMNALGFPISRTKSVCLMKEADIQVRHKKKCKVTTNSNHKQPLFENLLERQFDVEQPNQIFVSDITYVWTQED
jgi:transposase InsO family protein